MIEEVKAYRITCDRCKSLFYNNCDIILSEDVENLETELELENEWKIIEGKHYCPHCIQELSELSELPLG